MAEVELFTFHGSNACLTAELVLRHAGLSYRERRLLPVLHVASLRLRGFDGPTVPAARVDGERVQGSRSIAHVVAERVPEAGLLPVDPERREVVLDAERAGEQLQNATRRIMYVLAQRDASIVRPLIDANYGFLPPPLRAGATRILVTAASKGHRARHDRVERDLDRVAGLLDRFDELAEQGVLGSDEPNVADFQIGPNLALLALAPNVAEVLRARPAWRIAERVLAEYPLDVVASAPDAWADRLRARSAEDRD